MDFGPCGKVGAVRARRVPPGGEELAGIEDDNRTETLTDGGFRDFPGHRASIASLVGLSRGKVARGGRRRLSGGVSGCSRVEAGSTQANVCSGTIGAN